MTTIPPPNPNTAGAGFHIPAYPPSLLERIEAQKLQPRSPYAAYNQGDDDDFFTSTDPTLPPDTANKLEYDELPGGRWIRILKLEPGLVFNALVCSLVPIDLDDPNHIEYEALSYTWGAYYDGDLQTSILSRVQNPIVCNSVWKSVTPSLAHALFHFRRADRPRYLWTDALCINQGSDPEKSVQVALMQAIYAAAKETLVWVGWRSDPEVEKAMNLLCYLANQECDIESRFGVRAIWYDDGTAIETPRISGRPASAESWYSDDHPEDTEVVPFAPTTLAALVPLFEANYFGRLWVFQEIALSELSAMFWGKSRVRFEWVALVADLIERRYMAEFAAYEKALAGLSMCAKMHRARCGDYAETTFFDLLMATADLNATWPADKVWGLMGIETNDSKPHENMLFIQPNAKMEGKEVFKIVAKKVLLENKDLRCLAAVEHSKCKEKEYGFDGRPSWVPNFARKRATFLPDLNASTHDGTEACIAESRCAISDCLAFEGIEIDVVTTTEDLGLIAEDHHRSRGQFQSLQRLIERLSLSQSETIIASCLTAGFNIDMKSKVTDMDKHISALQAFRKLEEYLHAGQDIVQPPPESAGEEEKIGYKFFQATLRAMNKRKVFLTTCGMMGAGPVVVEAGDIVVVLFGGSVPFVLRPKDDHYQLIGQCFVEGLMEGQRIHDWRRSSLPSKSFHII